MSETSSPTVSPAAFLASVLPYVIAGLLSWGLEPAVRIGSSLLHPAGDRPSHSISPVRGRGDGGEGVPATSRGVQLNAPTTPPAAPALTLVEGSPPPPPRGRG